MTEPTRVRGEATAFSDYATIVSVRALFGVLALVSVLFTTRLLTPKAFGALSLFFVISLLVVTVSATWTSFAVTRLGREELELTGHMAAITGARAVFVVPAFIAAALVVVGLEAGGALPREFTMGLAVLSLGYAAVWVTFDHVVYLVETWGRQKLSAVAVLVQQVIYVAAVAVLYFGRVDVAPAGVALVAMSTMGLLTLVLGYLVRSVGLRRGRPERAVVRRVWTVSSPLIAFVVSSYVMRSVDLLVISSFSTAAAVGTYAIAYQGYGVMQTLATTAGPMFAPLFVSLRMAERESTMRLFVERLVPKLSFVAALLAAIAMAPAYALVPTLLGPGFRGAQAPLALLFSAAALFFAASLLGAVVAVFDRTRAIAWVNIVAAAVNALLDVTLIGGLGAGVWAAAAATIVSVTVIWVGYAVLANQCVGGGRRPGVAWLAPLAAATVPLFCLDGAPAVIASIAAALAASGGAFVYGVLFEPADARLIELLDMPELAKRWTVSLLRLTRT